MEQDRKVYTCHAHIVHCTFVGAPKGRGSDAIPRQEAMFRRVQVPKVQAEVDVGKQLGQHGPGMHQMSHQCLPPQTGNCTHSYVCTVVLDTGIYIYISI